MDRSRAFLTCRWAGMTLDLPHPVWLDSEDKPWCCMRTQPPNPLETTDTCRSCANWRLRPDAKPYEVSGH